MRLTKKFIAARIQRIHMPEGSWLEFTRYNSGYALSFMQGNTCVKVLRIGTIAEIDMFINGMLAMQDIKEQ